MSKAFLNKTFTFLLLTVFLLSLSPSSAMAVVDFSSLKIFGDPDPCLVGTNAADAAIKAATTGLSGPAIAASVPVDSVVSNYQLMQIQASACAAKKATEAVKNKTVGKSIFGIPTASLGLPTSWDGVAKIAMKAVIKKLTDDTVLWINGGPNEKPKFVTNPGQYFADVANGLADDFILGTDSPLNFLCTPFAQNIRLSLRSNYTTRQSYNPQCTFTGIAGFLNEGFNRGGWQDWFNVTQNAENNPYDSYLNAQVELDSRIQSALKIKQDQLNWGSGFLSFGTKCTDFVDDNHPGKKINGECVNGTITKTPGVVIQDQLQRVLGQGVTDLGLARSFDDVVSALIGALSRKVFSNNGLLSSGGYSGGSDTTSGLENDPGLTPAPQDFGPGTDPTSGVTCAPDKTSALFNDPVTWTATVTEAEGITYSYEWSGSDVPADSTDSALVMNYTKEGNKKASVKITAVQNINASSTPTTRTSTIDCSSAVTVAEFAPLIINSCTTAPGSEQAIVNIPFATDTKGRGIMMARVTWIANISGGSGTLAINNPIVWSGESRDNSIHVILVRDSLQRIDKEMDVPLWNPSFSWAAGRVVGDLQDYGSGTNGTQQTITKNADGTTQIKFSRLYYLALDGSETDRNVGAKITVRDKNPFIANSGRADRDCKPAVFIYKPR